MPYAKGAPSCAGRKLAHATVGDVHGRWLDRLLRVDTASPGDGEAAGGAARVTSPEPCDRSTSYSRHSRQRGRRVQRLLGASQREFARRRPPSATAAKQPSKPLT